MLYLDYAKPVSGIGYILNFFADSEEDIEEVSGGKSFVSKNGINYGVPLASSTIVITQPDKTKKTYVLSEDGNWYAGGANPGSKVEVNTVSASAIRFPILNNISVDGEIYRTINIGTSTRPMSDFDYPVSHLEYIFYENRMYQNDNISVNQNTAGQSVTKLENFVLNGKYYGITNDGVTSIGGVKGDITLGPQLKISNKEISVNIEANAETTQDTPELTSLKIADNVYKIPTNNNPSNNVITLEGELEQLGGGPARLKVTLSSNQEGMDILNSFKNGDTIRVTYKDQDGHLIHVGQVVYCTDYTWCGANLNYIGLYVIATIDEEPSIVKLDLRLPE